MRFKKFQNVAGLHATLVILSVSFFIFAQLAVISSCSSHSAGTSFTSKLDLIDAYISHDNSVDAIKSLKKLEKEAYSSYERLGIYKRYMVLGEKNSAESVLTKGIKKLGNNEELHAVYVNFLLRENRIDEAYNYSLKLKGTKYSSMYSEAVLRIAMSGGEDMDSVFNGTERKIKKKGKKGEKTAEMLSPKEVFSDIRFSPIYNGAFKASGDSKWIFNAASVLMRNGMYRDASVLYPDRISSFKESLFWGCVFFDAGYYAESLQTLLASHKLADLSGKAQNETDIKAEILSLEADCYYISGDDLSSEKKREELLSFENEKYASPVIYMNSALYAKRTGNFRQQYDKLLSLVNRYPSYEPGLAGYGELALAALMAPKEDAYKTELRNAGLKTLEMERYDSLPKVSFEDVLERIKNAIEENGRENSKGTSYAVLEENLVASKKRIGGTFNPAQDVWRVLEKNSKADNSYPEELVRYAVEKLVSVQMNEDAYGLFSTFMQKKYGFNAEEKPGEIELWECEYSAWFNAMQKNYSNAKLLYDYIADHYGDRSAVLNSAGKNNSVVNSCVNLGVIYASIDREKEALEVLNKASSRATNAVDKAEILYRMAELNWSSGDERSAARNLQYAMSLNPSHNKARLLLKKIQAAK